MLTVIGIIAILAALLLTVFAKAKERAKRIACVNNLKQTGVAFISFAQDHNGGFPMTVPISNGGSEEYARSGYQIGGDFYFSFRHFKPLAYELTTPKVLHCAADSREPASSFVTFSNQNLSYFVCVNADFDKPESVLAGDRNLTNDYAGWSTMVELGANQFLRWTEELHKFKGNVLFADGHVKELNSLNLMSLVPDLPGTADIALPSVPAPPVVVASGGGGTIQDGMPHSAPRVVPTNYFATRMTNFMRFATSKGGGRMAAGAAPTRPGASTMRNPGPPLMVFPDNPPPLADTIQSNPPARSKEAEDVPKLPAITAAPATAPPAVLQAAATAARADAQPWWWLLLLLLLIVLLMFENWRARRARRGWLLKLARRRSKVGVRQRVGLL